MDPRGDGLSRLPTLDKPGSWSKKKMLSTTLLAQEIPAQAVRLSAPHEVSV